MERLIKKCEGIKFQVDVIYDYLNELKPEESAGSIKTTEKTLESKLNALCTYRGRYESYFEELCMEADSDVLADIQGAYQEFQKRCTAIEEIIDFLLQNFWFN